MPPPPGHWNVNAEDGPDMGRFFEYSIGWRLHTQGWKVEYHGRLRGRADLGRDLIVTRGSTRAIVQCKYQHTPVPAKEVYYLYGTAADYQKLHDLTAIYCAFYSHASFMPEAQEAAERLKVCVFERVRMPPFPQIRCVNREARVYYEPWHPHYDRFVLDAARGDCQVWNTEEAEALGYTPAAYKPHWKPARPEDYILYNKAPHTKPAQPTPPPPAAQYGDEGSIPLFAADRFSPDFAMGSCELPEPQYPIVPRPPSPPWWRRLMGG